MAAVVGVWSPPAWRDAPPPRPEPIDLASLASYPPVPAHRHESVTLTGAGDIASCRSTGDEATAALLEDLPG